MWIKADFGAKPDHSAVIGEVVGKLGGLHILVNNAGTIRRNNSIDFTEADWDAVIDVNLKSVFFLSQAAARHMIPGGWRQDHQHRFDAFVPGRHSRALLYREQERRSPASRSCSRMSGQ